MDSLMWGLLIAGTVVLVLWYRDRRADSQHVAPAETAAPMPAPSQQRGSATSDDRTAAGWELSDAETVVRSSAKPRSFHRLHEPGAKG